MKKENIVRETEFSDFHMEIQKVCEALVSSARHNIEELQLHVCTSFDLKIPWLIFDYPENGSWQ